MIKFLIKHILGFFYDLIQYGKISPLLSFHPGSRFERGRHVRIGSLQLRGHLSVAEGTTILSKAIINENVKIGRYSKIGKNFSCHGDVAIGNYCAIAQDCFIVSHNHRVDLAALQIDFLRTNFPSIDVESRGKVVIGHGVWLGKSVIVLPNVTVGNGAVVGAGAVVTRDVAPYSVVAGNPARIKKMRFSQTEIDKIEKSQWFIKSPIELVDYENFFNEKRL